MKRIFSISFLLLYLNSFTEIHEALRLPVLFEHYAEHKKLVNELSFWEFLVMHYKTDVPHDEHDNQLPFKVPGHSFAAITHAIPTHKIILNETLASIKVVHVSIYQEAYLPSRLQDIFQPPRI